MPSSTKRKTSNAKSSVKKRSRPSPKAVQTKSTKKAKIVKEEPGASNSDDETYDGGDVVFEEGEEEEDGSGISTFQQECSPCILVLIMRKNIVLVFNESSEASPPQKKSVRNGSRIRRDSSKVDDGSDDFSNGSSIISKDTLKFLADLSRNNDRDWFNGQTERFKKAQRNFEAFVSKLGEKIMENDPTVPELPLKDLIFRIYRDIRFSNDQTPYKVQLIYCTSSSLV